MWFLSASDVEGQGRGLNTIDGAIQQKNVTLTADCPDCGGRCVLRVHSEGNLITRVETDNGDEPQCRACAKGRAIRQLVHSPQRIKYPSRRIGKRGEGQFQRISWDEALDTVAEELDRARKRFGPRSILLVNGSGSTGKVHGFGSAAHSFLSCLGGYTSTWGSPSAEASIWSSRVTYGTLATAHTRDDLVNSRLIIMWAWNPSVTIQGTNTRNYLNQCKESGARIIGVDPVFTDSIAAFADEWVPIRPGTDTALLLGMAYAMIKMGLHDQRFLDDYTVGFKEFSAYLNGEEDGVSKTPAWASAISGVPVETIDRLARAYATIKPAALMPGYGPGRASYGEQFHRAVSVLAAMTGNIGIPGGNSAGFGFLAYSGLPVVANPAEVQPSALDASFSSSFKSTQRIHNAQVWDALLNGKDGGYPDDYKVLYVICSNCLNQGLNLKKGLAALQRPGFIIVHEPWMTPTARFADILLPVTSYLERRELTKPPYPERYFIYGDKAVDPLYESRTDRDILMGLAARLGLENYPRTTEESLLAEVSRLPDMKGLPPMEELKQKGIHKIRADRPVVAFEDQIKDPQHNPFPTPSGKIEIFSKRVADLSDPELPPLPKYLRPAEGYDAAMAALYPLQLITVHCLQRANSVFENVPWLTELLPRALAINPVDASKRGITHGEKVSVFNSRGETVIAACVTERIAPGVVKMDQGAWYAPDDMQVDLGGNANVLTMDGYSPAGGFPFNTCLVQVKKRV